jgi:CBS domain-containing protein
MRAKIGHQRVPPQRASGTPVVVNHHDYRGAPVEHDVDGVIDSARQRHHVPGSERPPALVTVPLSATVYDAVDVMLDGHAPVVVVVDDDGQPRGALRWDSLVADLRPNGQLR